MRLPIDKKDKLIKILQDFKGIACHANPSLELELKAITMPCLICVYKTICGIKSANAIEDLFNLPTNEEILDIICKTLYPNYELEKSIRESFQPLSQKLFDRIMI